MTIAGLLCRGLAALLLLGAPSLAQPGSESVQAFLSQHPASGTYTITAYLVDIYLCPPCSAGSYCKPCIPDNITLSDLPSLTQPQAKSNRTLRVFLLPSQAAPLQIGRRYDIQIEAGNSPKYISAEPAR